VLKLISLFASYMDMFFRIVLNQALLPFEFAGFEFLYSGFKTVSPELNQNGFKSPPFKFSINDV